MVLSRIQTERLVEQKLGLSLTAIMIDHNKRTETGLLVDSITNGGAAHLAGLQKNDVILIEGTVAEYMQTLYANRGKEVNLNVATGAANKSVESCPQRVVTVIVQP
jgi:S1-C subfamily serine protease